MPYLSLLLLLTLSPLPAAAQGTALAGRSLAVGPGSQAVQRAVYLVYYWRARPGRTADYADYIRTVAEPIDEDARKAGVFEEVRTYTPAIVTGAPGADWTHMRVFRLKSYAALDQFSQGMDDATRRVFPDAAQRTRNAQRSAELRDLLRQEIWYDFR